MGRSAERGRGRIRRGHGRLANYNDFSPQKSNPGRGWVAVRAAELSRDAIVDALATGEFYASTGVTLAELEASADGVRIEIDPEPFRLYSTRFVGKDGKLLAEVAGPRPSTSLRATRAT